MTSVFHVVCFDLKENEVDVALIAALRDVCVNTIPGLIELRFGKNEKDTYPGKAERSQGYTHALVSRHTSADHLEVYIKHPDHVALSKAIMSAATRKPVALDFVDVTTKKQVGSTRSSKL